MNRIEHVLKIGGKVWVVTDDRPRPTTIEELIAGMPYYPSDPRAVTEPGVVLSDGTEVVPSAIAPDPAFGGELACYPHVRGPR